MQGDLQHVSATCPLSKLAVAYLDLLDSPTILPQSSLRLPLADEQDSRIVERLNLHLPACQVCTNAVVQARVRRATQRAAFQELLLANEQAVPSTLIAVQEAIRQEPSSQYAEARTTDALPLIDIAPFRRTIVLKSGQRSYRLLQGLLSFAAVIALVFATTLFFNHMVQHSTPGPSAAPASPLFTSGWEAAVIGRNLNGKMSIENYNPFTGRHISLLTPFAATSSAIDGISHDGHHLLYHYSRSGLTYYATLTAPAQISNFYSLSQAGAGAALWVSDSRHVLIALQPRGLLEVDSETGVAYSISSTLSLSHLYFYRDNDLYFSDTAHPLMLWRVNVSTGQVELVVRTTHGRSYFLSPDGSTIFYVDASDTPSGAAIYTIKVAMLAAGPHLLLSSNAIPVGFALDNTLELVQEVQQSFQIVKLRPTQPTIERVVLADIAPTAVSLCDHLPATSNTSASICDENLALAPYGSDLLVTALTKDGTRQVWADNLITRQKLLLQTVNSTDSTHIQLPGWDRLQVG